MSLCAVHGAALTASINDFARVTANGTQECYLLNREKLNLTIDVNGNNSRTMTFRNTDRNFQTPRGFETPYSVSKRHKLKTVIQNTLYRVAISATCRNSFSWGFETPLIVKFGFLNLQIFNCVL